MPVGARPIDVLRIFTGHRLQKIREAYKITRRELAAEMGYTVRYLIAVERQRVSVPRRVRPRGGMTLRLKRRKYRYKSEWVTLYLDCVKRIAESRPAPNAIDDLIRATRGYEPKPK